MVALRATKITSPPWRTCSNANARPKPPVAPLGLIFGPRQLNRFLPPGYATMSLNTRGIIMFATINQFFTTFGAPVMVPVLLLIIARSLRVPWGQAAQSALAAGFFDLLN